MNTSIQPNSPRGRLALIIPATHTRTPSIAQVPLSITSPHLPRIAASLHSGAHACGLLTFSSRAQQPHVAATTRSLADVTTLVKEISTLVRHGNPPA